MPAQFETTNETTRLESFSDGVFAIASTLLVFQIHVPTQAEVVNDGLLKALRDLWPSYLALSISFFNILILWTNHHVIFKVINRNTPALFLFNGLFLLSIVFAPFPTSVLSQHLTGSGSKVAAALFVSWFAIITLCLNLIWWYSAIGRRLLLKEVNPSFIRTTSWRYGLAAVCYALAAGVAAVNSTLGVGISVVIAGFSILPLGGKDVRS